MKHLLLAALLALALAPRPAAAADGTLNIGLREDPDVLDPTLGSSGAGRIVYATMCNRLFDWDTNLNLVPQLATGYEYTDPTHLVIHLRPNVAFQDGEVMDAEAVKTSLMRDLTAKGSMRAGEISAIATVNVIDPQTIRLDLKAPSAPLLAQLADRAGIIMAPKALADEGDRFGLHPVCVGPYAFDQRVAQGPHRAEARPELLGRCELSLRPGGLSSAGQLPPCASPTCRPARWTSSNTSCPPTSRPCSTTRSCGC